MNDLTKKLAAIFLLLTLSGTAAAALPDPGVEIVKGCTALVITDPQNDFLSPDGVTWGVVGESVKANNTVENIDSLFKVAKANDMPVFISPHYYPTDHGWQFEGALEALMHAIGMFDRKGTLMTEGLEGFEVAVLSDATAAAIVEDGNGYEAALVNVLWIANTVWTTKEAVRKINE